MLTREQYDAALKIAQSYINVDAQPDSRYGRRLAELMALIGEYERAHKLTHADIQVRVDRARRAR